MTYEKFKSSRYIKLILWFGTALLIALLFPKAEVVDIEAEAGNIWLKEDLIADRSFPILKNEKVYAAEVDSAIKAVKQVFVVTESDSLINDTIRSLQRALDRAFMDHSRLETDRVLTIFSPATKAYLISFYDSTSGKTSQIYKNLDNIEAIMIRVSQSGTLSLNYDQIPKDTIAIRRGNFQENKSKYDYAELNIANKRIAVDLANYYTDSLEYRALTEVATKLFVAKLAYSSELTAEETDIARNKVSKNSGIVVNNERIISKHERITPETKMKLDSFKSARVQDLNLFDKARQYSGKFLHIAVLLGLLGAFLYNFRKTIFEDNIKLAIFSVLFLSVSYLTYLTNAFNIGGSWHLLILIPTVSLLLTIMFDSRVGIYSTLIISLISAGLGGNDYSIVVLHVVAGTLGVYSVRDIKNRQQIYRGMIFIFLGYSLVNLFLSFESLSEWSRLLESVLYSGINSLLSPILTYGLLIFFEKTFKITTDLTLVELSNTDHPLLKEMYHASPGTFYHSQSVARLAEAAAEKIGADTLLVKVGALYHDIGKSISPYYFIENQGPAQNLHNELTPEISVKVIKDHVTMGIELAKRQHLPQEIIEFIPTHHGTGLIKIFYDKAVQLYGKENVNKDDYRYVGPKPHTREQAILMMADKCESASRSLTTPEPQTLENLINNLINQTLHEKELDEAPITLSEVEEIKKVFFNSLMTSKHSRIRYPEQEKLEKESKD